MQRKPTINLAIPETLLNEFNAVCRAYGHNKQKGQVLSAALMMFLEADPRDQGFWVEEVMRADVAQGIEQLLDKVRKQQGLRVASRDAMESIAAVGPPAKSSPLPPRETGPLPAKAAKKRRAAQTPIKPIKRGKGRGPE